MRHAILWLVLLLMLCQLTALAVPVEQTETLDFTVSSADQSVADAIIYTALTSMGYNVNITSMRMSSAVVAADSGAFDGIAFQIPAAVADARNLILVPESIFEAEYWVYVRKGSALETNSWADLQGLRVAHEVQRPFIQQRMLEHGIIPTQMVGRSTLFAALLNGDVDAVVLPKFAGSDIPMPAAVTERAKLDTTLAYTYLHKSNAALAPKLAITYRQMKQSGLLAKILNRDKSFFQDEGNSFLHISSYTNNIQTDVDISNGIQTAIMQNRNHELRILSLDSSSTPNPQARLETAETTLRLDYVATRPDVIIVTDQYALEFIENVYYRLFLGVPVIYTGLPTDLADTLQGMEVYFTNITEQIAAKETVTQMLAMYPNTKHLFVLNDSFADGRLWQKEIAAQLEEFEDRLDITYNKALPLQELLIQLQNLPKDTLVLTGWYFTEADGRAFAGNELHRQLAGHTAAPVFGLNLASFGGGQLGGLYVNRTAEGQFAGEVAVALAKGEDISALLSSAKDKMPNQWIFDYAAMQQAPTMKRKLPEGATILNRPRSLVRDEPVVSALVLLIFVLGVVFIIRLTRQNRELMLTKDSLNTAELLLKKDMDIKLVKEKLETIIESAPLAFITMYHNGTIVHTNQRAQEVLGLLPGDNIAKVYDINADSADIVREVEAKGTVFDKFASVLMADGAHHRYLVNVSGSEHEGQKSLLLWCFDIEMLEERSDSLERAQQDLQRMIDALPLPMLIVNPVNYQIVYANDLFAKQFTQGQTPDSLSSYLLAPQDADAIVSPDASIEEVELQLRLPDNTMIDVVCISAGLVYNGRYAVSVMLKDITAQKLQAAMLQNTAEKEKEANQLKSTFIVNMSHEIRTPMNAIIGLSELELRKKHDPKTHSAFTKIASASNVLLNIINDILDFSKMEAQKLSIFADEFSMMQTLGSALLVFQQHHQQQVEILVEVDLSIPATLLGDSTRLWQILKNILDNSRKFTKEGHIAFRTTLQSREAAQCVLVFTIEDTGSGMTDAQVERLFTPFEQFHKKTGKDVGTGLGMSITKQLVALMGGTMTVESTLGKGTTTAIVMPFAVPADVPTVLAEQDKLTGKTFVVIADNETAATNLVQLLSAVQMTGHSVSTAQAAETLHESTADIILFDETFGGVTATQLSLATHLPPQAHLLQLTLTQDANNDTLGECMEKPVLPTAILQMVSQLCRGYEVARDETTLPQYPAARVLLCEDNYINQEVALGMLEAFGIHATVADNGQEALTLLANQPFDLVLMDILMPVMDGHQTARAIRGNNTPFQHVPIVAMTANAMAEEVNICREEGMNGHIAKPIEFDNLAAQLKCWLGANRTGTQ